MVIPILCSSELVNTVVHAKVQFSFSMMISVFSKAGLHSISKFAVDFRPMSVVSCAASCLTQRQNVCTVIIRISSNNYSTYVLPFRNAIYRSIAL